MSKAVRSPVVGVLTAWAVVLSPFAAARAQTPNDAAEFLTPESVAVVTFRPKQVLTNPALALMPIEVATAAGEEYLGIDLTQITSATAVIEPPLGTQLYYALAMKADQPWDLKRLSPELTQHTEPGQIAGREALISQEAAAPSMVVEGKTLLVGTVGMLNKLLSPNRPQGESKLAEMVTNRTSPDDLYAGIDLATLQPLIQMGLMQARQDVPAEFQRFLEIPLLLDSAELWLTVDGSNPSRLVGHAGGPIGAGQVEKLIKEGVEILVAKMREEYASQLEQLKSSDDPVERAMGAYMERVTENSLDLFVPKREGDSFVVFDTGEGDGQSLVAVGTIGMLVALLLPAVQASREAARRAQATNNMKQIMLALLNYHDTHGRFPAQAITSEDGKPLLSWRVAILPYLEQQALYDQFHLDEPWDSEHNLQLIPRMPAVYHDPSSMNAQSEGKSDYLGVTGKDAFFSGKPQGRSIRTILDGTSQTVAVLQVSDTETKTWTKPEDWELDKTNVVRGLFGPHPNLFLAGYVDGHVRVIQAGIDLGEWYKALTVAGGEVIDSREF